MRSSISLLFASTAILASFTACDEADPAATPAGTVRDASVEIVACNSNLQRQLTFTFTANDRDVAFDTAGIHGLPLGDLDMTLDASVPADQILVVRCVETIQLAGGQTSSEANGTAHVDLTMTAGDETFTATFDAPFSGGTQAFDNCGNVLLPDGCSIVAE